MALKQTPLFLKAPSQSEILLDPKKYQDLALENDGIGYLNFHMILRRLKTKKYGPGKNMIKE